MRIALTVGHSLLKNGSYTSASGEDCGGVNEYKYNKKLMKKVKEYLESDGHSVDLYICPEKVFTAASQEKSWKLTRLNAKNYDLVVEGHLNCYNGKAHGTEVLYVSEMVRGTQREYRRNWYPLDLQIVTCRRERTCTC